MLHCCCFLCASFKKCGNAFVTHCMCWPRLPVVFSSRAGGGGSVLRAKNVCVYT